MSSAVIPDQRPHEHDPYHVGRHGMPEGSEATGHGTGGPASKRVVVAYGFWVFLISDIIMFSAFIATYIVLLGRTAGGPTSHDRFELATVSLETFLLLTSSFVCGLGAIAAERRALWWTELALLITGALGFGFLWLEVEEFVHLIETSAGPQRSAFFSAFFSLVGCHGGHVLIGLLWLGTMMAQLIAKGFSEQVMRRLMCFNLFWHALDIVWVAIFTIVYLLGVFSYA